MAYGLRRNSGQRKTQTTDYSLVVYVGDRYESHLRKLRQTLRINSLQYRRAIAEYFPAETRISQPQGGFFLWVELDKRISTVELYKMALKQGISIAPGRMFTLQNQFDNCMRLRYGLPWSDQLEHTLKTLGTLAKSLYTL